MGAFSIVFLYRIKSPVWLDTCKLKDINTNKPRIFKASHKKSTHISTANKQVCLFLPRGCNQRLFFFDINKNC